MREKITDREGTVAACLPGLRVAAATDSKGSGGDKEGGSAAPVMPQPPRKKHDKSKRPKSNADEELTFQIVGRKKRSHVPSILERVVVKRERIQPQPQGQRWRQRVGQRKIKFPSSVEWFLLICHSWVKDGICKHGDPCKYKRLLQSLMQVRNIRPRVKKCLKNISCPDEVTVLRHRR